MRLLPGFSQAAANLILIVLRLWHCLVCFEPTKAPLAGFAVTAAMYFTARYYERRP